ncbi:hypothetical protein THAOC_06098, partial [Thalassiosira oceanica]
MSMKASRNHRGERASPLIHDLFLDSHETPKEKGRGKILNSCRSDQYLSSKSSKCKALSEYGIEELDPTKNLQICRLEASRYRSKSAKSYEYELRLFSAGGKALTEFDKLEKLVDGSKSGKKCPVFSPFPNDESGAKPPAFAQANIFVDNVVNVTQLTLSGSAEEGLLNKQIFLDQDWITTVGDIDIEKSYKGEIEVEVWPRMKNMSIDTTNTSRTIVVEVFNETVTFDKDIDKNQGVEFLGMTSDARVEVKGTVGMHGRLSFKNMEVSFIDGMINATGPVIFQYSKIKEVSRCPEFFREIRGQCFYLAEIPGQADSAAETCEFYDRGSLPVYHDILPYVEEVTKLYSVPNSTAWIAPEDSNKCTALNIDGTIQSFDVSKEEECEKFTSVLCTSSTKESMIGQKYTSYFSTQYMRNHAELYTRILDPTRLPFQAGGTLTVFREDGWTDSSEIVGGVNSTQYEVTDEPPLALIVDVKLAYGEQSDVAVALDTYNDPSFAWPHHWNFTWNSTSDANALPTKIQVHSTGRVCVSSIDLLFRNRTNADNLALSIPASLFKGCLKYNVCDGTDEQLCGRSLMYIDHTNNCAVLDIGNKVYPRDLSLNTLKGFCTRL